jgi:tubby-related protein 1
MDKNSVSYLGKLRGNKTGSIYQLYDCGKQPESNINRRLWRCSLARIEYETNILGMNGPRKLQVIIPDDKQ